MQQQKLMPPPLANHLKRSGVSSRIHLLILQCKYYIILFCFLISNYLTSQIPPTDNIQPIMESVVKIDVVSSAPDFSIPWQHSETGESSGSGCVISGPNGIDLCIIFSFPIRSCISCATAHTWSQWINYRGDIITAHC